jgi:hypothetical protein
MNIYDTICGDWVFCLHVCLCEGVRSPGTGVTDSCKLPCGCWKLNPSALEEQPMLLTAEPSVKPLFVLFICLVFHETEFLCVALAVLELTL